MASDKQKRSVVCKDFKLYLLEHKVVTYLSGQITTVVGNYRLLTLSERTTDSEANNQATSSHRTSKTMLRFYCRQFTVRYTRPLNAYPRIIWIVGLIRKKQC